MTFDATSTGLMFDGYLNAIMTIITSHLPLLLGIGAGFFVLWYLIRKSKKFIK